MLADEEERIRENSENEARLLGIFVAPATSVGPMALVHGVLCDHFLMINTGPSKLVD